MKKPGRLLVTVLTIPFLGGCFGVVQTPLPEAPAEREALNLRGVVIGDPGDGERIEFKEVLDVQWTDDALRVVASQNGDNGFEVVTRTYPVSSLSAVLVREIDANRTSGVVIGIFAGLFVAFAFIFNAEGKDGVLER